MAAHALAKEGFVVAALIFTAPAFDLVSKWGRAIHAIQVKSGFRDQSTPPENLTFLGFCLLLQ